MENAQNVRNPAPVAPIPDPVVQNAVPVVQHPVQVVQNPAPVAQNPAPVAQNSAPVAQIRRSPLVELIECCVCSSTFGYARDSEVAGSPVVKPIVGSCGHSLCQECATEGRENPCPICMRPDAFRLHVQNFQMNDTLEALVWNERYYTIQLDVVQGAKEEMRTAAANKEAALRECRSQREALLAESQEHMAMLANVDVELRDTRVLLESSRQAEEISRAIALSEKEVLEKEKAALKAELEKQLSKIDELTRENGALKEFFQTQNERIDSIVGRITNVNNENARRNESGGGQAPVQVPTPSVRTEEPVARESGGPNTKNQTLISGQMIINNCILVGGDVTLNFAGPSTSGTGSEDNSQPPSRQLRKRESGGGQTMIEVPTPSVDQEDPAAPGSDGCPQTKRARSGVPNSGNK